MLIMRSICLVSIIQSLLLLIKMNINSTTLDYDSQVMRFKDVYLYDCGMYIIYIIIV